MAKRTNAVLETLLAASQAECLALRHKINDMQQQAMQQPLFNDKHEAHRKWLAYVKATRLEQRSRGVRAVSYKPFDMWLNDGCPAL